MSTPTTPATGSDTPRTDEQERRYDRIWGAFEGDRRELVYADFARTLESELAAAQTLVDNQAEDIERLLADKARLDWLEANGDELWCTENVAGNIEDYWIHPTRAAIDAARKEGQP